MNLKKENGFGVTDAIIAMVLIAIFATLIVSVSYNIYIQSNFIKRNDTATNYIVSLFEYAKSLDFNSVDYLTLEDYFSNDNNVTPTNNYNTIVNKGYYIIIEVIDIEEGFIKQINATVKYKLGSKIKTLEMSTLINL